MAFTKQPRRLARQVAYGFCRAVADERQLFGSKTTDDVRTQQDVRVWLELLEQKMKVIVHETNWVS